MNKLFLEFNSVDTKNWLEIIKKDLKGADIKKLMRKTIDGLTFEPFYRKENTDSLPTTNSLPNQFPFLRGYKVNNDWTIRQDFLFENIDKAIDDAKKANEKGISTVGFDFDRVVNLSQDEFDKLTKNIDNIAFEAFERQDNSYELIKNSNKKFKTAFLNFDPLTYKAFTGNFYDRQDEIWGKFGELLSNDIEGVKTIGINLHHYANAGASPVMQLAFGIATAAEYFNYAVGNKIPLEKAINNIYFNIALGCDYFMEIAKIRAFRYLFSKLVEAFDPTLKDKAKTHIHGVTLRRNKTIYDAHVNMLRTTIETLAGVVGGVDSFTTEPYNAVFAKPAEFAQRIAVNQQIIIKEEAYADKVTDPAGGSYYVENLTIKLIEEAWNLFLKIDEKGGMCESLMSGFVKEMVDEVADKELKLVETGKIAILGTNKYPNKQETLKDVNIDKPFYLSDFEYTEKEFEPLKIYRLSEKFEDLRSSTEKSDKKPSVFLLTYGHKAMRRARADFAGNFFAVAGFNVIDNVGFDNIDEAVQKINQSNSHIVVLCSSDDAYFDLAKSVKGILADKTIVIAGNPENKADIEALGIEKFIHVKSNIYQELVDFKIKLS